MVKIFFLVSLFSSLCFGSFLPTPPGDFSTTGSLTSACASGVSCGAGSTVSLSVNGVSSGRLGISGTWVGTIVVDVSVDNFATFLTQAICGTTSGCTTSGTTVNGTFPILGMGSVTQVRARMSAFTSGTASISLVASQGNGTQGVINFGDTTSGSADSSSSPIKIGARYNATMPTFADGNRADVQTNQHGALSTSGRWTHNNIHGATAGTLIHTGSLTLHAICVNTQSGGTITVYDNTSVAGSAIYTIVTASGTSGAPTCLAPLDDEFSTGLEVVTTAGSTDVTFLWR